jgi:hypothetical protein
MQAAQIPMDLDGYDAKIYLPIMQDYYDKQYPGLYTFYYAKIP